MFGEKVEGFTVPVLNEREVRAGAGILFFVTTTVFWGAWYADIIIPAQMMIVAFFIDFLIRVINPRYSPSLILGRLAVSNQKPDYTGAAPKRFAWFIGLSLASFMMITLVFLQNMSILNFAICGFCIVLLFMESCFGICIGCLVYSKIFKVNLDLCAGDICEVKKKEPIQEVSLLNWLWLVVFAGIIAGSYYLLKYNMEKNPTHGPNHKIMKQIQENIKESAPLEKPQEMPSEHKH